MEQAVTQLFHIPVWTIGEDYVTAGTVAYEMNNCTNNVIKIMQYLYRVILKLIKIIDIFNLRIKPVSWIIFYQGVKI